MTMKTWALVCFGLAFGAALLAETIQVSNHYGASERLEEAIGMSGIMGWCGEDYRLADQEFDMLKDVGVS